jgi:hypothetical protein
MGVPADVITQGKQAVKAWVMEFFFSPLIV